MGEIRGGQLVDSLVLKLFLSLFPLLIVAVAILGFVASRRAGGSTALTDDLVANLKLKGEMADLLKDLVSTAEDKRGAASIVGLIGVTFSGLAVVGAFAAMCNAAWQVSSRGFIDRIVGFGWLIGAFVLFVAVAAATSLVQFIRIPFVNTLAGFGAGVVTVAALFWWTNLCLTNIRIPPRAYLPGAFVGAIGVSLFQVFGAVLMQRILKSASAGAGSIAAVVAFLTFFSIIGRLFLLSVLVNVVAWERRHGTVQLAIHAPSIPTAAWVQTQRGGQRGKRKRNKNSIAQRAAERAKSQAQRRFGRGGVERDT